MLAVLPGQRAGATAVSRLTQDQLDAGAVPAEVTATAVPPRGTTAVEASATTTVPVPLPGSVQVELLLDGRPAAEGAEVLVPAGSTLTWTYRVTNTGPVTLHDVRVTDDGTVEAAVREAGTGPTLAPGETVDLAATSVAAVGRWSRTVTVTATATGAGGEVTDDDSTWFTGTLVVVDPVDGTTPDAGAGAGADHGATSDVSGATGGPTGDRLALTGAPTAQLVALALLHTGLGAALARVRDRRRGAGTR